MLHKKYDHLFVKFYFIINKCLKKLINFIDLLLSEEIKEKYNIKYKLK